MSRFDCFWGLIQKEATKNDSCFFMDAGEGREFQTKDMEGEDISGWLVSIHEKEAFLNEWNKPDRNLASWERCYCFAVWERSGENVAVRFEKYD